MKKLALILALMLVPCTAFGLEMLTDNALDNVTGQSGVSIGADDIQIFINVERIAWIDCDGYGTENAYGGDCDSTVGGALYLDNFQMDTLNINMIGARGDIYAFGNSEANQTQSFNSTEAAGGATPALAGSDCGVIDLFYNYGDESLNSCLLVGSVAGATNTAGLNNYININPWLTGAMSSGFLAKSLTIDATGELPLHSAGWARNKGGISASGITETIGGVIIGLPTMEIYIHSMSMTPRFTAEISSNSAWTETCYNDSESYGTIEMEGITFSLLSGWIEIAPTGRRGDNY